MEVFWSRGFAATSTEDLLGAMGIGRQSLYNAFGDKRQLYVEALRTYQRGSISDHVRRLTAPASPIAGIEDLLVGLAQEDDARRALGCMGVGSVGEFGMSDPELVALREQASPVLHGRLIERIGEGQAKGEIDPTLDAGATAGFIQMTMTGLQTAARAGGSLADLHGLARFTVDLIRTK
ncbi:TetR family transcriptional regulator [Sphingomonas sp. DBB INV C78]|uniref:TetR/AcrR family transcriptional regulator n=1 Tax=Sphingomonas sp. DBB INV C78 TaxID=3349434 RepID=UPI0036D3AF5A